MKQLQSYVSCVPSICYAVVSDGNHTQITIRNGNTFCEAMTLPEFSKPSGKLYKTYTYENLKNHTSYCCKINEEDFEDVILQNLSSGKTITDFSYEKVIRCGTVAAGTLHYVSDSEYKNVLLPDVFDVNPTKHFLLKVSGDSMIDFDIEDGDMIVLQQQSYANVGDIVVAGNKTTNEATLKKYYPTSAMVMLAPGNNRYEPIMVKPEDLFINGVVVGIMKDKGVTGI